MLDNPSSTPLTTRAHMYKFQYVPKIVTTASTSARLREISHLKEEDEMLTKQLARRNFCKK